MLIYVQKNQQKQLQPSVAITKAITSTKKIHVTIVVATKTRQKSDRDTHQIRNNSFELDF